MKRNAKCSSKQSDFQNQKGMSYPHSFSPFLPQIGHQGQRNEANLQDHTVNGRVRAKLRFPDSHSLEYIMLPSQSILREESGKCSTKYLGKFDCLALTNSVPMGK